MPYSCHYCGEIDETDVQLRCMACGSTSVMRAAAGNRCAECDTTGPGAPVCPTCGSEELES